MTQIVFENKAVRQMGVHILPTKKFKTNTIVINILQNLQEDTVTETALLPQILKRASAKYSDPREVRRYLDGLYGAVFDMDVIKKGEYQIIQIYLELANEMYLADQTPLLSKGIQFLGDMLSHPLTEGEAFVEKYVNMEKEMLKKKIDSLIDDKIRYANQRVTEEMCKDEPYRLLVYGTKEALPQITGRNLYSYYLKLLKENPIDIYVVGNVDREQIEADIDRYFPISRQQIVKPAETVVHSHVDKENVVVERINVNQGKLNIGCRTQIGIKDENYVTLLMYNGVLGGFPHSKLFANVREKASLAYYASSRLESHKGILMIMSGIEIANYDQALTIIKEQLNEMKKGNISKEELQQTKATLSNQLREILDNARTMVDFAYNGEISGRARTLEGILEQIERTTIADIQRVAEQVAIDTVYFLRDQEGR